MAINPSLILIILYLLWPVKLKDGKASKEIKAILEQLHNKGDFKHNVCQVLEKGRGQLRWSSPLTKLVFMIVCLVFVGMECLLKKICGDISPHEEVKNHV